MEKLTKIEQIVLLSFLKTAVNRNIVGENLKKEIAPIYFKLEKEFRKNGR